MTKIDNFEKSQNAEKCESRDLLGFFNIQFVVKYQKNAKGAPLRHLKFSEVSVPKKIERVHFRPVSYVTLKME